MKKTLFFLLSLIIIQTALAQSVGIGTNSPNTKAILDISSNNRGILIPSMTTSQRLGITSPPNGLMVYDIDKNEFHHYTGTGWSPILNGGYWLRPITSRKIISNNQDSVGIGVTLPTQLLDVDGNIRTRTNLLADNNVAATGTVSGGTVVSTGNLIASGNSTLFGDVTTNADVIINNSTATMQLRNGSNENKGFFQLSGNNVRLGTNSGNTTGDLIIRMNGNDRITVRENGNVGIGNAGSPVYKLYITGDTYNDGNINIDGKITKQSSSGSANLIPLCYGKVSANGTMLSGTNNVSVNWVSEASGLFEEGYYTINCPGITNNSIIMVTDNSNGGNPAPNYIYGITASYSSSGVARVYASWHILAAAEVYKIQTDFSFVIYNY